MKISKWLPKCKLSVSLILAVVACTFSICLIISMYLSDISASAIQRKLCMFLDSFVSETYDSHYGLSLFPNYFEFDGRKDVTSKHSSELTIMDDMSFVQEAFEDIFYRKVDKLSAYSISFVEDDFAKIVIKDQEGVEVYPPIGVWFQGGLDGRIDDWRVGFLQPLSTLDSEYEEVW